MSKYSEQMEAVESIQNQCMWMIRTSQRLISTTYKNAVSKVLQALADFGSWLRVTY